MSASLWLVAVALLLAVVHCHPVTVLKGALPPSTWSRVSSASASERVSFILALPQQRLDELERRFWAVSEPDSADYGLFLSTEEIQALVSPPYSERQALIAWLESYGVDVDDVRDYGDSIEATASTAVASALFGASFHVFEHTESGRRLVRAMGDVSLPSEVVGRVEMVYGLTGFPVPHYRVRGGAGEGLGAAMAGNDAVIPQTLYAMYGLPRNTTVGTSSGISQGVIEWEGESFSAADLLSYATNVSLNGQPVYPEEQIVGPNVPRQPGGESTLDVDMIVGVAPANSNWFWLEGNQSAWLYTFAVHFLNTTTVPDVISISYGWFEGDQCENGIGGAECKALNVNSTQFVQRVNTEWMKIGMRGVSVMVSSGDSGCHTRSDETCQRPTLLADYPASSPYITSVGATEVQNGTMFPTDTAPACRARTNCTHCEAYTVGLVKNFSCIAGGPEVAVSYGYSRYASGGGFSNISAPQAYQSSAVAGYLAQTSILPPASMFNAKGRGYPDVSANGHNGYMLIGGTELLDAGTSQSSPIFAGVVALLNVHYKRLTNSTLGFINPLLYRMWADNPAAFNDIVEGSNICTESGCNKNCKGFVAAKGWDPVTGLGTPNYPSMLDYIDQLAARVVQRRADRAAAKQLRDSRPLLAALLA